MVTARSTASRFPRSRSFFDNSGEYLEIFDLAHSDAEDRFIGIGPIDRGIVVVVYTEPEDDLVRIIGARFATRREQERYRKYMDG